MKRNISLISLFTAFMFFMATIIPPAWGSEVVVKISDLPELAATPAENDVLPIVDVSASSTAKITYKNLMVDPNVVDALMTYGSGSSFTKTTIDSALTAIGTSTKKVLLLRSGTWVFGANADYSSYTNITFRFVPGAIISHGDYTLVLPGQPDAGLWQIFSGNGRVTGVKEAYPEWFGAVGDGTTDDYAAFLSAASCFPDTQTGFRRGTLLLQDQTSYMLGTSFLVHNNLSIESRGWNSKILTSASTGAAIEIQQTTWSNETARRGGQYKNFTIQYSSGSSAGGLLVTSGGHIEVDNVQITGFTVSASYGLSFGSGPTVEFSTNRLYCEGNYYNVYIPQTASLTTANFHNFSNRGATNHGFYISGNGVVGLSFTGRTVMESNTGSGFIYEAGTQEPIGWLFDGVYFEANNSAITGKQVDIQGSVSKSVYNVNITNCTFVTGGTSCTGSFAYNYIRNLTAINNRFPGQALPNYDVWDLGSNIGQVWTGNTPGTTVNGISLLTGTLIESNFPTIKTRDNTHSGAGLWGVDNTAVLSLSDDGTGSLYSATNSFLGMINCWAGFAGGWITIFVNWDGSTVSYETTAGLTGTAAMVIGSSPTTGSITDGYLGIGIFKDGTSLKIQAMNRGGGTKTVGMKFSGTQP